MRDFFVIDPKIEDNENSQVSIALAKGKDDEHNFLL